MYGLGILVGAFIVMTVLIVRGSDFIITFTGERAAL
jgi:hypothetical protein